MAAPQSSPKRTSESQEFGSGRFMIIGPLGQGGMGEVYQALDTKLKRAVAIKRLPPELRNDPEYRQKLLEEAERASSLNCPYIAGLYDVVEEGSEVCLVMEFVEGTNLRQRLMQPMPLLTFLEVALQCVDALIAAHDRGIVHRDIKPENIMVTKSGRVKVLDFGLAREIRPVEKLEAKEGDDTVTSVGMVSGTVGYMSPETLLQRPIDARTDVFSLGVVFYEALTGRHPFRDASFMATADRVLHSDPPHASTINTQVPPQLDFVIERMIAKNAQDRYMTAQELRTALWNVQQQVSSGEWHAPLLTPRRKRVVSAVALIVLVAAVIAWSGPVILSKLSRVSAAPLPEQMRVAVLPFRSLDEDPTKQAYARGLTETLTTRLAQVTASRPIDVVPSLEIVNHKVSDVDAARVQLGANLVLEGSVHTSGNDVRVNFALLDARTKKQLRAQTMTSTLKAGFAFEDQLSDVITNMLDVELSAAERAKSVPTGPATADARELYLQGRGYLQDASKNAKNLSLARDAFSAAVSADPNFAAAYAGLGTVAWLQYGETHEAALVDQAREACGRAVTLDGSSVEAHECLGRVYNGTGQYEDAAKELKRVLDRDPTRDSAIRLLARNYESMQKLQLAEQTYQSALKLRPQYWLGYSALGGLYYRQARYGDSAKMFAKSIELAPDSSRGYFNLAGVLIEQRKYREALPLLEKSIAIEPSAAGYANRGTVSAYLGNWDAAARDYEKAIAVQSSDYELWGNLGEALYWSQTRKAESPAAYGRAIELAEQAAKINPKDGQLRALVAKYQAMSGQNDKAAAEIAAALRLAPKDGKVLFCAAVVEQQTGHSDRAKSWLNKAVQAGYSPASVLDDPVFASLRGDPQFKKSIGQ
jgi:serine/threonine-protein kinase